MIGRRLLPAVILLAGCQSPGGREVVNDVLEGLVMTPAERCAEARLSVEDLVRQDPAQETRWRAWAVAACGLGG